MHLCNFRRLLAFLLLLALPVPSASGQAIRKKLIATGWDNPTPRQFREGLSRMEQLPFDGAVITMQGRDLKTGKPAGNFSSAFSPQLWKRVWYQEAIADLKAVHSRKLTDNFLLFNANPGDVDWFDDAGWAQIIDHFRIAAWCARQGGLRGLLFDPERYTEPFATHSQFAYAAQSQRDQHTLHEYTLQARKRGQEVMRAITQEYPDITIFGYFLISYSLRALDSRAPLEALSGETYGLMPAFLNGWLDAAPAGVTFVDGNESTYTYNSEVQFLEKARKIRLDGQVLIAPENRAKFRAQVQVSSGIYLDAYCNPPGSPYFVDGLGEPRVRRLEVNVTTALRCSDQYTWIYGEKGRWWPGGANGPSRPWTEILPGCVDALAQARSPYEAALSRLKMLQRESSAHNLVENSGLEQANPKGLPAGWSFWQEEGSHGKWSREAAPGAAGSFAIRLSGITNGCVLQTISVKPGERYLVAALCRQQGEPEPWVTIRWQTEKGAWTEEEKDSRLLAPAEFTGSGWQRLVGIVRVPGSAGKLALLAGVSGQIRSSDAVWLRDLEVYRLP